MRILVIAVTLMLLTCGPRIEDYKLRVGDQVSISIPTFSRCTGTILRPYRVVLYTGSPISYYVSIYCGDAGRSEVILPEVVLVPKEGHQ